MCKHTHTPANDVVSVWSETLKDCPFFPQKRLLALESLERLALKRQKLAEQRSQQQMAENGLLSRNSHNATSPSFHPSLRSKTEFAQADALIGIHAQNSFSCNTQPVSEGRKKETKVELQNGLNCPQHSLITVLHKKKKSKKHKDKERHWLANDQGDGELETCKFKQKPNETDSKSWIFSDRSTLS